MQCLTPSAGGLQQGEAGGGQGSPGQVDVCPVVTADPQPPDLSCQDFSTASQLYRLPLGPQHTNTVMAAYAASISENTRKHRHTHTSIDTHT